MDIRKRAKIINEIKSYLAYDSNLESNPDFRDFITLILENPTKMLDEDDFFEFDDSKCVSQCSGECCSSEIIRISPIDVDYLMRSEFVKENKLTREVIVNQFLDIYLGPNSLIPTALIKKLSFFGRSLCPFMRFGDFINAPGIGGVCSLGQELRPNVCKLTPLGRAKIPLDSGEEIIFYYLGNTCAATESSIRISVSDHLGDYLERTAVYSEYLEFMSGIVENLSILDSESLRMTVLESFLAFLFLGKSNTSKKLETIRKITDTLLGVVKDGSVERIGEILSLLRTQRKEDED